MGVSKNRGIPKWMVKIMENPIKMMIWGVSHIFGLTPISCNIVLCSSQVVQDIGNSGLEDHSLNRHECFFLTDDVPSLMCVMVAASHLKLAKVNTRQWSLQNLSII